MTETSSGTAAAGGKKDRGILLAGLITYGVGQSLLYIIFAPLGQKIGMPAVIHPAAIGAGAAGFPGTAATEQELGRLQREEGLPDPVGSRE